MGEQDFKNKLFQHLAEVAYDDDWRAEPDETYALVLDHIIESINPKDSARGIIFALNKKREKLTKVR